MNSMSKFVRTKNWHRRAITFYELRIKATNQKQIKNIFEIIGIFQLSLLLFSF